MSTTSRTGSRSDKRDQFLTDVLTTAIENYGYGWFEVEEYVWENVPPCSAYATVTDEDGGTHRIDLDVIAAGLGVIRNAVPQVDPRHPGDGPVLHNADRSLRLYLSGEQRRSITVADRSNGDDADLDVLDALAVVECALFGRVVYA